MSGLVDLADDLRVLALAVVLLAQESAGGQVHEAVVALQLLAEGAFAAAGASDEEETLGRFPGLLDLWLTGFRFRRRVVHFFVDAGESECEGRYSTALVVAEIPYRAIARIQCLLDGLFFEFKIWIG